MADRAARRSTLAAWAAALLCLALASRSQAAEPVVRPALDGIFAAFERHPLVGLGDHHELANEEAFYAAVVRDPRFAASVGNVVVEFGGSQHQDTLDRYLAGEDVPYGELAKVWRETVGWNPTVMGVGYETFFAQVRAVNQALPPDQRIHVWLGEPPIDWSAIRTRDAWQRVYDQRDAHAAEVIERDVLSRGRKALVIYGGNHFNQIPWPSTMPIPPGGVAILREIVERTHPGAFYVITLYTGYAKAGCSAAFEAQAKLPRGVLAAPVRGTSLEGALLRPECRTPSLAGIQPPPPPAEMARLEAREYEIDTGVAGDALLYLGPAAELVRAPMDPTIWMDQDYHDELSRRAEVRGRTPMPFSELIPRVATPPQPLWPR